MIDQDLDKKIDLVWKLLIIEYGEKLISEEVVEKINFDRPIFSNEINNLIFIEKTYNSKDFNDKQKEEIKNGFNDGLSADQINLYNDSSIDYETMKEIRKGLKKGLSNEDVIYLLSLKISAFQTKMAIEDLQGGLNKNEIELYAKSILSDDQAKEIRTAVLNNLPHEKIMKLINVNFKGEQLRELRRYLERENAPIDGYQVLENPSFSSEKIRIIGKFLEKENNTNYDVLNSDVIKFITENNFNSKQLEVIYEAIYDVPFLKLGQVKAICKDILDYDKMAILVDLVKRGLDHDRLFSETNNQNDLEYYEELARKIKRELKIKSKN